LRANGFAATNVVQDGFVGKFAGADLSASSAVTQQRLGWRPNGPGLIEDLNNMRYFED